MHDEHNLLVISDLHLGEDLGAVPSHTSQVEETQEALLAFLGHYTAHRVDGRPWKLVINGDMVDFLSIYLAPDAAGFEGTEDDRAWGVGASEPASLAKFERVVERHGPFFEALARFAGRGNEVHLVVGNHDADFHWASVQQRFAEVLECFWVGKGEPLGSRVRFHNWFFFEPGLAYLEHGHQYDGFCSFEDPLTPEDVSRPDTLEENLGTAAMRYLGNHLPVDPDATADLSFPEYLHLILQSRHDVLFKFVGGYVTVIRVLWNQWLTRMQNRGEFKARKKRRAERMAAYASAQGIDSAVLEKLHRLRRPPIFINLLQLVRSVMLGRLITAFLLLAAIPFVFPLVSFFFSVGVALAVCLLLALGVAATHVWLANGRDNVDPTEQMRKSAGKISKLMHVPIVVFGHSHVPIAHRMGRSAWYFNAGSWAGGAQRDHAFTHVVITRSAGRAKAALCRWKAGESRELRAETARLGLQVRPGLSGGY